MMSIIFITIVAFLPGIAWLIFFLREDVHPEPRRAIAYAFFLGAAVALPVIAVQLLGQGLIELILPNSLLLIIFLAGAEEVAKWVAANTAVGDRGLLTEPVDYMIYMIAAALGLATLENFFVILGSMGGLSSQGPLISEHATNLTVLRFVGATFLHAAASGLVGFYWEKTHMQSSWKPLVWGMGLATIIHAMFNYLVFTFQAYDTLIYPTLFLIVVAVFLMQDFDKLQQFEEEVEREGLDSFS